MKLYAFDAAGRRFFEIEDLGALDRLKRHSWVGYNVFATSSPAWEERLLSAVWSRG